MIDIQKQLQACGLRRTPQRQAILGYLNGNTEHPSAERIHRALLAVHPGLSLATVYNTLAVLKSHGEVLELTVGRERRFDPNIKPHHHFVCVRCGGIRDIAGLAAPRARLAGCTVTECRVEFRGLCASCGSGRTHVKEVPPRGGNYSRPPRGGEGAAR